MKGDRRWEQQVQKVISKSSLPDRLWLNDKEVVQLLRRQHAAFVRLAKRLDAKEYVNMSNDFQAGQHNAYMSILAALQQEGKR